MACDCKRQIKKLFKWTNDNGDVVYYTSEMAAKAKVMRKGGSYTTEKG